MPQDDQLVINVRTSQMDIDKVSVGQPVTLPLSSFDQRITPEFFAKFATVSPDLTLDTVTGQSYYTTSVLIPESERDRLGNDLKLIPGMRVEAFIRTSDKTVLSYLIHPFTEEIQQAFRED